MRPSVMKKLNFVVASEHVQDFVLYHLLYRLAGGGEVLSGVEMGGIVVEILSYRCGARQSYVAVYVDFAYGGHGGFSEHLLGYALRDILPPFSLIMRTNC